MVTGHRDELHRVRLDLCRRAVEHQRNGTTELAPGVMRREVAVYTDPGRFTVEQQKLFRESPQIVCLSSDLPEPGSYRLFDDVDVPILVKRGRDGVVRAFLNICRHRGARLVRPESGKSLNATCRFHGWTYDAQGKAIGISQEGHFCGAIDDLKLLVEFPAVERHGLVFVLPTQGGTLDVDAYLGDFGAELAKLDLDAAVNVKEGCLDVTCNWKYALDTYFENYHFASLHKNSLAPLYLNDICLYDTWGPHHRLVFPPREVRQWAEQPEAEWLSDFIGTPYFIFPNTIVYLGSLTPTSSYVTLFRLYPLDVGGMRTRMATYAPHGANAPEQRAEIESAFEGFVQLVGTEDYSVTGESWQHLLTMPAGAEFVFGRQEIALQHFHRCLDAAIGLG